LPARVGETARFATALVSRALVGIDAVIDPATGPADLRRALRGRAIDVIPEVRPDTRMPPAGSVLVADDDETNRKMIRSALAGAGYDFTIVDNGADALDAARSRAFDIMLLDVRMPEIDGLELTRRIRAMGGPQPRILVMTADTASSTEAAARGNGADAVLLKPVPPSILVDTIRRTIEISPSNPPAAVPDGRMTVDLDRVIAFFEDRHLALGFLGDFRSHTGERLEELRGDPDPELVRRVAHQLRNVSSMLGVDGVAALAAEIDRPDGPPDGWASGASRLRNALAVMIDSVEIHLGGGAA